MILIIHDLDKSFFEKTKFNKIKNSKVIFVDDILPCQGCFKCWLETPGSCCLDDNYKNNGDLFKKASKIIIISESKYGTYSSKIKNFLDRSIGYVKPQFVLVYGEMHHAKRHKKKLNVDFYFYGDINEKEEETLKLLVEANKENLDCEYNLYINKSSKEYINE